MMQSNNSNIVKTEGENDIKKTDEDIANKSQKLKKIYDFYSNYESTLPKNYWSPLHPSVYLGLQMRQRAMIKILSDNMDLDDIKKKVILEIGSGEGKNLLEMIYLGFSPENIIANDLVPDRLETSMKTLPASIRYIAGDANNLDIENNSIDIVYQSTVFTSITDDKMKQDLANAILRWVKPAEMGGGILWFDFIHGNWFDFIHGKNGKTSNTKGINISEIRRLFPGTKITKYRVYVDNAICRVIERISPRLLIWMYPILHTIPFLRSHYICWIQKK